MSDERYWHRRAQDTTRLTAIVVVVLHEDGLSFGIDHHFGPVDVVSVAEVLVLGDDHHTVADLTQRHQGQLLQARTVDVQRGTYSEKTIDSEI